MEGRFFYFTVVVKGEKLEGRKLSGGRRCFAKDQVDVFKKFFQTHPIPSSNEFKTLSKDTGLQRHQVKIWFQNRRAKEKALKQGGKGPVTDMNRLTSTRPAAGDAVMHRPAAEMGLFDLVNSKDCSHSNPASEKDQFQDDPMLDAHPGRNPGPPKTSSLQSCEGEG